MMLFINIVTGILASALVLILFARIREADKHLKLDRYRSQDEGFVDLLNYASVVNHGVIVGKNGALMAAWYYAGDDIASATDDERNAVAVAINQAFSGFGNGWMVHIDSVRREAPAYSERSRSNFPDPVTAAIDEERRKYFEKQGQVYDSVFVLVVTFLPPLLAERKFIELMFDDDAEAPNARQRTAGIITDFKDKCNEAALGLSSMLKLHRLAAYTETDADGHSATYDDFLRYLNYAVTGDNHRIALPENPVYLDGLICNKELHTGTIPRVGNRFVQIVSIDGYPAQSSPGILSVLAELPSEYRWSNRFIFVDRHEAESVLQKYRKKWKQKVRGFVDQLTGNAGGQVDEDAQNMVADADGALREVREGYVASGYFTSVVVLMDKDREQLEASAEYIANAIRNQGFSARVETLNTMEAYLGSLPGHGYQNVRRPLMNSLNLAHLIPTSTIWTGHPVNPCNLYPENSPPLTHGMTSGNSPFRLNLHVGDVGHTLMIGPTGSGKSTHLALIAAQFRRYTRASVFAFDKRRSMYALCKAAGGKHFEIGGDDDRLNFAPLQFLETRSDRRWAAEFIDTILKLNDVKATPAQRNEIAAALMSMQNNGHKTFTDFVGTVQDQAIRDALQQYTIDGAMGELLDATEDGLGLSDFTVFEMEHIMGMSDKYALPVLLYLFRRVERALKGQPAIIILDEAWTMLGHHVFREKIKEWLVELRKLNCLVLMATQSLTQAAASGILELIAESCQTKIFLANPEALSEKPFELYSNMGLNRKQIEIIASATKKRDYYYVSENGRRRYTLALGPLALAFVGVSDLESVAHIKQLERQHGERWVDEWLALRGLSLKDYAAYDDVEEVAA